MGSLDREEACKARQACQARKRDKGFCSSGPEESFVHLVLFPLVLLDEVLEHGGSVLALALLHPVAGKQRIKKVDAFVFTHEVMLWEQKRSNLNRNDISSSMPHETIS